MCAARPTLLHMRRHFHLIAIEAPLTADNITVDVAKESLMSFLVVFKLFDVCVCNHF
jgi:hypothetical protein